MPSWILKIPENHVLRIGFQGEIGAFSELAANHFFTDTPFEVVPSPTFETLFDALSDGEIDEAVVPMVRIVFMPASPARASRDSRLSSKASSSRCAWACSTLTSAA